MIVCGRICPADTLAKIDDVQQIKYSAKVLQDYADGWRDSWNGPPGGVINLAFYNGDQVIGTFGMTSAGNGEVLISVGTLSRRAPSGEIVKLTDRLGIVWPRGYRP